MKGAGWNPLLKSAPFSQKLNALSIGAECLYYRLLAQCDDGSNYYGEPRWIQAKLYPDRMLAGQVSDHDVKGWVDELEDVQLAALYQQMDRTYIHLIDVKKCARKDVHKDLRFPDFADPLRTRAQARNVYVAVEGEGEGDLDQKEKEKKEGAAVAASAPPSAPPTKPEESNSPSLLPLPPKPTKNGASDDIPANLKTPEFLAAWQKWERHRREIKKPLKPTMRKEQLTMMSGWGPKRAVAALEHTISMGWQGIREPDPPKRGNGNGATVPGPAASAWESWDQEHRVDLMRLMWKANSGKPAVLETIRAVQAGEKSPPVWMIDELITINKNNQRAMNASLSGAA